MACKLELKKDNSVSLEIILTNKNTNPIYVNDSSVIAEIFDPDAVVIVSGFALPYVVGSDGVYRETIAPIAGLTSGVIYTVKITATGADGIIGNWLLKIKATK